MIVWRASTAFTLSLLERCFASRQYFARVDGVASRCPALLFRGAALGQFYVAAAAAAR